MKRLYKMFVILSVFFSTTNLFSQTASVTWPLTSDQNPNTPVGNIQALPQSIGTPTSPYKLEMYPQEPYSNSNRGQQLWTGNQGTGWISGLPDYTRYIQFDANPTSGNSFTVQNISFDYSDYPTPTNFDFHILNSEVWYSTDNWNNGIQLNANPLDYLSSAIQTFSANVNVLVQNGQTFSLRIYPYAPNGAIAMTPSFATHRNVIFEGTTSPVELNNGSICGMKFNDLNGNGEKEGGEPGLSGWEIQLTNETVVPPITITATTDENGEFCFNDLAAGTYTISETQQEDWQQTYPTNPTTHTVILAAGQNVLDVDFGNMQLLGSICGMKFNDLNGNGQNDNEPGLSGWTIMLSMGAVQMTATTGTDGGYCFNDLLAGTYTISETQQEGWQQTYPASPGTHTISLSPGVNLIGIDLGNKEILNPDCIDFENNSMNDWQANNILTSFQQDGNNHFIQTTDQAGVSTFYTTSKPYNGNWTSLFSNGCGSLCFDVTFIYGGDVYNGQTPPQTLTPYIAIEGNGFKASFVVNQSISVGDGWHTFCAPLSFLNSDGTLPSNSDGYWIMTVGTANDWNTLLTNVTKVRLLADPTSFQGEKIGYDNICLNNTGDCNPPVTLGSICGIKILDKDEDGEKDSNEDGIPNWTIYLSNGTSTISTTTDANGNYCFDDLPAGTYSVSEEQRTGWKQIFPPDPGIHTITLSAGEELTNINFSNVEDITIQLGYICGIKFNDINGDGNQDLPDEVGLPNWTFNLTGAANLTATTDIRGNFCFENLRPGDYIITEVIQDGWEVTTPNTSGTYSLTLLPGQNITDIKFGNKEKLGSICGMKYNDLNGDGDWDSGEPGLSGWQISLSLWGYTSSGHASGPTLNEIAIDTTDENGNYCFTNVRQGNYLIGEYHKSGWTQTEPATFAYSVTLTPGQIIVELNFGNKEDTTVQLGSICGIKFNDKDGDGEQDPEELGIPDWQINLGGMRDLSVYTDKEGKFCFDNLPPGEYKVGEEFRSGWRQTLPSTNFYIIQLASGENITDLIFGNTEDDSVQLGSICGTKFNDKNRDGRKVSGEPGIAVWTIYLEGPMNLTAVTDGNGNFCFYGLIPGTYTVREENKTGWRQTKPSSITYTLEVGNGDNFTGIDFGNTEDPTVILGTICGIKFNDINGNGSQDGGEPGIANWTIELTGAITMTTTTDARGEFCFTNLILGNYIVSERNRDGWTQTAPTGGTYSIELTADHNPDDIIFGNREDTTVVLGSICGMKFFDKDGDGRKGLTEPGIADWQINISGPVDRSVTTDKNGEFCFDDLPPGTYIIKEEPKTDWVQTYPTSPDSYTVTLASGENLIGYYFGNKYEPKPGCVDPPSGMKAWWSFDYIPNNSTPDLAGYNNAGTKMNGPTAVAGKVLGALQFDGVDDYVEVEDHFELNFGTGDFSFDAWIKTSDIDWFSMVLDKASSYVNPIGYAIFLHEGNLGLSLYDGLESSYISPVFISDGIWHHITVTVSRTNKNGIIFYLDGVPTTFGDPTLRPGSLDNINDLRIGRQSTINEKYFKGILDEIELFNRVITPAEIVSIYNAGSSGKCKPTDGLTTASGHVFHDINGNGIEDAGDKPLPNWTVLINGPTIAQTETDDDGNFVFTGCKPGDYTLSGAVPNEWGCTFPFGGRYQFKLEEGQSLAAHNFGYANDPCTDGQKSWYPLGSGVNGAVLALAVLGNDLYVGGVFTNAGGVNVRSIAKWNGSSWSDVGGGVIGQVMSFAVIGNDLYVGGVFSAAGNISANNIAKWDGLNWSSLGDGTNGVVQALAANGTTLFAGGEFTTAGNVNAAHVAKWNGSSWSALGTGTNNFVYALTASGNDLYVGGKFTMAGNVNAARVAKWNVINSSWSSIGTGLNNTVSALAIMNGEIYAGGSFNNPVGFNALNRVSKWDGTNWITLGNGVSGSGTVYSSAIAFNGTDMFVGGLFTTAGTVSANHIAKWDGNWMALGNGVGGFLNSTVILALATNGTNLYAGGSFTTAGRIAANNIARYSCSSTTTSVDDDHSTNILPQDFKLEQNYPNPFNPSSTIRYHIPKASYVKITVYDILGREIKVLVNEMKNPGQHEVVFNSKGLASGVYIYTIITSDYTLSKKMILLK